MGVITRRRSLVPVALLVVVASGCGGGSPTGSQPSQPGSSPSSAPSPSPSEAVTPTNAPTTAPTTAAASPTADPYALAAVFEGRYSGTWVNDTYGSTGPASIDLKLDRAAGAMDVTLTLGGNVFGQPTPKPEQLVAKITLGEGLFFTSKTFGPTTVKVDISGGVPVITVTSPNVPSARVKSFTATATITRPKAIELDYHVTFRDATPRAKGTATLTRG